MELYVCWGSWRAGNHACGIACEALTAAGHRPQVIRCFGQRSLPDIPFNLSRGRRRVRRLTGSSSVPVLVDDEGAVTAGSKDIVAWSEADRAR